MMEELRSEMKVKSGVGDVRGSSALGTVNGTPLQIYTSSTCSTKSGRMSRTTTLLHMQQWSKNALPNSAKCPKDWEQNKRHRCEEAILHNAQLGRQAVGEAGDMGSLTILCRFGGCGDVRVEMAKDGRATSA